MLLYGEWVPDQVETPVIRALLFWSK